MKRLLKAAIHLVLLMTVTSSVVAENTPQPLTKNLNLPPESINFDLSDLIDAEQKRREQKQRDEWAKYQTKMTTAFTETQAFTESESDPAAGVEAWQRFLTAFEANNPFNKEDDSMRVQAKKAMIELQEIERTLQTEWSNYQEKMTKAYQEILAFLETKPNSNLQTQSINRFLEAFSADNPFSEEDESMRRDARGGLTNLELVVTASNGAAKRDPDAIGDQAMHGYLYEPTLTETQQLIAQRWKLQARNYEFDAAIARSQDLLDSVDPLRDANPSTYGQIMINHGTLRCAAGEYQLGLSIINRGMGFLEASIERRMEFLKPKTDSLPLDAILLNGVMAKGICQLTLGALTEALDTFRWAQEISHYDKGVYNEEQLTIISFLTATYFRQRNLLAADQQQRFSLVIAEKSHGPDSVKILPTLIQLGSYFSSRAKAIPSGVDSELRPEASILFNDAVFMYNRAIAITEINYSVNDLRLLKPLRGLATAGLFERTLSKNAEVALLRALEIVNSNPLSDQNDRAQAMVDLGDLYIVISDEKAQETYLEAWTILKESPNKQQLVSSFFGSPVRLYPKKFPVLYLDRTPPFATPEDQLFVNLKYNVSVDGQAEEVKVIDGNVPIEYQRMLRQSLLASRYRPRILDGEFVSTEGLQDRQLFAVVNR